jgi:SAM-dependent methyltransferase
MSLRRSRTGGSRRYDRAVRLKDAAELSRSPVVASSSMNRDRGLAAYAKDLGVDLTERLRGGARWLDLCCGRARALHEAAARFPDLSIIGVDLAASHDRHPADRVRIIEADLSTWAADGTLDLITCVHGLHYVGDKLGLLRRALAWLAADGLLLANLDLSNIRWTDGRSAARWTTRALRAAGLRWNGRTRALRADGPATLDLTGIEYVGADDAAGPNCTGQPAVASHYRRLR